MSNDVFEGWPSEGSPQEPRASNGGAQTPKPIPYSPPQGPSNINNPQRPGLGGTNHGNCGTQGRH